MNGRKKYAATINARFPQWAKAPGPPNTDALTPAVCPPRVLLYPVDGRHHPDLAVSGLGASSSDCFIDVDYFDFANLVAGKLNKSGTVTLPEAALEHWHSHAFKAISGQRRAFTGDVVAHVPKVQDGGRNNAHPLTHYLRVHVIVASPHLDNQVEKRVWGQDEAAVERHHEAPASLYIHNSCFVGCKVVNETSSSAMGEVRHLYLFVLFILQVQVKSFLKNVVVPNRVYNGVGNFW